MNCMYKWSSCFKLRLVFFKLLVLQLDGERMSHTYTTTRLHTAAHTHHNHTHKSSSNHQPPYLNLAAEKIYMNTSMFTWQFVEVVGIEPTLVR